MLRRLRVKNFKLLRDVALEFSNDSSIPTVLIGTNASGKSTVIEVLDFLSRCAEDGLGAALVAHGGLNAVRTIGATEPIEIETTWAFRVLPPWPTKDWGLRWILSIDATSQILTESLTDGDNVLVATHDGARKVIDETDGEASSAIDDRSILAFLARVDESRFPGLFWLRTILRSLRVLGAVSSGPAWSRASSDRASPRDALVISTQAFVGREGLGLANALYNLQTDHHDAWMRLERAFRAEFPFVKRIVFPPDPAGSRISFAIEDRRFPDRKVYASEMSDGMIVFLCLLALVVQPHQAGVLALDEPDAHLHPSAVRRLLALASEPHLKRNLIIVTHSNAILDELKNPAESIRIVESSPGGATIRRLDAAALAAWRQEYSVSQMRQSGLLDPSNSSYGADE